MASKRLGSPVEKTLGADKKRTKQIGVGVEVMKIDADGNVFDVPPRIVTKPIKDEESTNTAKKLQIDVPITRAFCGVAGITPQTATYPPPNPEDLAKARLIDTTGDPRSTAYEKPLKYHTPASHVWVAMEMLHPGKASEEDKAMVKILGIFHDRTVALEHAEEHTRALYTVTNYGVRTESEAEEDADKASEDLSPNSRFERKLEFFRGLWEDEEEEDREDGGKKWTISWGGNVTEVWVEEREVYETVQDAGFHNPLPLLGLDDRDPLPEWAEDRSKSTCNLEG